MKESGPFLENPEALWEPPDATRSVSKDEIAGRIGRSPDSWRILSGGNANANVLLSSEVLRIYRRDPTQLKKEKALLGRAWKTFRVPKLLGDGDGFLRLEYVPNGPLPAARAWGRRTGCALAEIHSTTFRCGGFLDGALQVTEPLPDLLQALQKHAWEKLAGEAGSHLGELVVPVRNALEAWMSRMHAMLGVPVLLHGDFKPSNLHLSGEDILILDWEFAWAGPSMMDVGQLLRWCPPESFIEGFAEGYRSGGGQLPSDWRILAAVFDLVNLVGLLDGHSGTIRVRDVKSRIQQTLTEARSSNPVVP